MVTFKNEKELKSMTEEEITEYRNVLLNEYEHYDMLNQQEKLKSNSTFGALANAYCRLFTLDCAKSITLTGREISKHQIVTADNLIK